MSRKMENYDIREVLHNTINDQASQLLNSFGHLMNDSKIPTSEGGLENVKFNAFQLKIHHLEIVKALRVILQIGSDLDLGSVLLRHDERIKTLQETREKMQCYLAEHLAPTSRVSRHILNYGHFSAHQQTKEFKNKEVCQQENDDDGVMFEGKSTSQFSSMSNKQEDQYKILRPALTKETRRCSLTEEIKNVFVNMDFRHLSFVSSITLCKTLRTYYKSIIELSTNPFYPFFIAKFFILRKRLEASSLTVAKTHKPHVVVLQFFRTVKRKERLSKALREGSCTFSVRTERIRNLMEATGDFKKFQRQDDTKDHCTNTLVENPQPNGENCRRIYPLARIARLVKMVPGTQKCQTPRSVLNAIAEAAEQFTRSIAFLAACSAQQTQDIGSHSHDKTITLGLTDLVNVLKIHQVFSFLTEPSCLEFICTADVKNKIGFTISYEESFPDPFNEAPPETVYPPAKDTVGPPKPNKLLKKASKLPLNKNNATLDQFFSQNN